MISLVLNILVLNKFSYIFRFERSQDRMKQEDPRIEDARGLKKSVD